MLDDTPRILKCREGKIATPAAVIGARVEEISMRCGTYGQGGPGFAGFRIGTDRWLILTIWGSAEWLSLDGRPIEATRHRDGLNDRFNPIIRDDVIFGRDRSTDYNTELGRALPLPAEIREFAFSGHSGHMLLGEHRIAIAADPAQRPVFAGTGERRVFKPEDDLAMGWRIAPYPWIQV